ncbi:MAG: nucleotide exchange factor GrpE [Oscillospiraceae bacterium]|nr:nucleotide exchange factor GrpE [Oscillospiraceae bacterium]
MATNPTIPDNEKETVTAREAPETEAESPKTEPAEEQAPPDEGEIMALREKAEETAKELEEQKNQYLRLLAEYDNYRKRNQKERDHLYADGMASAVLALLPVYDNLERALQHETTDEAYRKGVEMTMNQLRESLQKLGVEEIPALNEPFDPAVHNAVMHVEDESLGENTIVEVFQTGFRTADRVIRFAMVKVAN